MNNPIYQKARRDLHRKILFKILGERCADCRSQKDLQFDHIDPATKKFNVGMRLDYSLERLKTEVTKCQLLCRSCHGKKTRRDNGFTGYKHGTYSMYINTRCRCGDCRRANAAHSRQRREALAI